MYDRIFVKIKKQFETHQYNSQRRYCDLKIYSIKHIQIRYKI